MLIEIVLAVCRAGNNLSFMRKGTVLFFGYAGVSFAWKGLALCYRVDILRGWLIAPESCLASKLAMIKLEREKYEKY